MVGSIVRVRGEEHPITPTSTVTLCTVLYFDESSRSTVFILVSCIRTAWTYCSATACFAYDIMVVPRVICTRPAQQQQFYIESDGESSCSNNEAPTTQQECPHSTTPTSTGAVAAATAVPTPPELEVEVVKQEYHKEQELDLVKQENHEEQELEAETATVEAPTTPSALARKTAVAETETTEQQATEHDLYETERTPQTCPSSHSAPTVGATPPKTGAVPPEQEEEQQQQQQEQNQQEDKEEVVALATATLNATSKTVPKAITVPLPNTTPTCTTPPAVPPQILPTRDLPIAQCLRQRHQPNDRHLASKIQQQMAVLKAATATRQLSQEQLAYHRQQQEQEQLAQNRAQLAQQSQDQGPAHVPLAQPPMKRIRHEQATDLATFAKDDMQLPRQTDQGLIRHQEQQLQLQRQLDHHDRLRVAMLQDLLLTFLEERMSQPFYMQLVVYSDPEKGRRCLFSEEDVNALAKALCKAILKSKKIRTKYSSSKKMRV